MDERTPEQLDKILALADSNHDGEAAAAVRKARQMLSRDGLSFGDLARAVSSNVYVKSPSWSFLSGGPEYLECQVRHLKQQVEELKSQLQTQELQTDGWKRRVFELEQLAIHAQAESDRWKKLASETADRLWEIARAMGGPDFPSPEHAQTPSIAESEK